MHPSLEPDAKEVRIRRSRLEVNNQMTAYYKISNTRPLCNKASGWSLPELRLDSSVSITVGRRNDAEGLR